MTGLLGWPGIFVLLVVAAFGAFLAAPGAVEGKSLAVLHGLCAQQPTHSYYFGDARLPFDARMTGIYGGFAMTVSVLALRGRWRAGSLPGAAVIVTLALLILPLAVDGANSFLKDVELPYLYEPRNALRTTTGLMLGLSLGSFIWLLIGQTAFRPTERTRLPVWSGVKELVLTLGLLLALSAALGASGLPLRLPLTYLLLVSATTVVTALLLPFVLLLSRCEQQAGKAADLARPATFALLAALLFIGAMSGGRFLLEALLGAPAAPTA